jgi:hypothetical protein
MAIFKTRDSAEAFAKEDPFILEGLVKSFVIKDWADSLLPRMRTTSQMAKSMSISRV